MKKINWLMMLMATFALAIVACEDSANNNDVPPTSEEHPEEMPEEQALFDVEVNIDQNSVEFIVTPADDEMTWHLITVPITMWDYYMNDLAFTVENFYLEILNQEIWMYSMAYSPEEVYAMIYMTGKQSMKAVGLEEDTDYRYIVAGVKVNDAGSSELTTELVMGDYHSGVIAL